MSYAIVFSSKTGNTRLLADTLRASLPQNECTYFGAPAPEALEAETLYIGFWTDKGHADDTLTAFLQTLKGKRVFLFGTAGFGGSAEYFEQILAAVQKSLDESNTVIGTYMCQGKMPMTVRQQYEKMLQQPNHAPNLRCGDPQVMRSNWLPFYRPYSFASQPFDCFAEDIQFCVPFFFWEEI